MKLEIVNKTPLDNIRIFVNDQLTASVSNAKEIITDIDLPGKIRVEFEPYKCQPIVRLDNIMLNYWLADIVLYDHCLEFQVEEDFFVRYRNKDIQGRMNHIPDIEKKGQHYFDKYIGINNLYPEIIQDIRKLLEK